MENLIRFHVLIRFAGSLICSLIAGVIVAMTVLCLAICLWAIYSAQGMTAASVLGIASGAAFALVIGLYIADVFNFGGYSLNLSPRFWLGAFIGGNLLIAAFSMYPGEALPWWVYGLSFVFIVLPDFSYLVACTVRQVFTELGDDSMLSESTSNEILLKPVFYRQGIEVTDINDKQVRDALALRETLLKADVPVLPDITLSRNGIEFRLATGIPGWLVDLSAAGKCLSLALTRTVIVTDSGKDEYNHYLDILVTAEHITPEPDEPDDFYPAAILALRRG